MGQDFAGLSGLLWEPMQSENLNSAKPSPEPPLLPAVLPSPPPVVLTAEPVPPLHASLRISNARLILAFVIAGISDGLSVFLTLTPPLEWPVDFVTALLLFAVLGWRWMILPGLIAEAVPGLSVFPFWVLVVASIAVWGKVKPQPPAKSA